MFLLFVPFVWVGLCSKVLGLRVALRCVAACAGNLPEARQFARGKVNRKGRKGEIRSRREGDDFAWSSLVDRRFLSLG